MWRPSVSLLGAPVRVCWRSVWRGLEEITAEVWLLCWARITTWWLPGQTYYLNWLLLQSVIRSILCSRYILCFSPVTQNFYNEVMGSWDKERSIFGNIMSILVIKQPRGPWSHFSRDISTFFAALFSPLLSSCPSLFPVKGSKLPPSCLQLLLSHLWSCCMRRTSLPALLMVLSSCCPSPWDSQSPALSAAFQRNMNTRPAE